MKIEYRPVAVVRGTWYTSVTKGSVKGGTGYI
jgi:hypothetical protein